MTDHPNVVPLRMSDRRLFDQVDYVELRGARHVTVGAMRLRRRSAALAGRASFTSRRYRAAVAIAFARLCDQLEDTYSGPRGFVWFLGTLLPICAAAFAVGYFGLRELLAVLS